MESQRPRVCIIGAGPGGMSTLYQMKLHAADELDVECYEKQEALGGMWNYTWRTGTDEYGEHVHSAMYKNLWTVGPKEAAEFCDYSFKDHFGKPLPSYVPREIYQQYLYGRFTKGKCGDMTPFVHFRHVVISVEYNDDADDFTVWIRDLPGNKDKKEIFSHVVVASGVFSVPNSPSFDGLSTFPGRIIHSHDFREAKEFVDQTVLIIGANISASEIAIQLIRFEAKHVICTYRNQPMNLKGAGTQYIEERPLLQKVDNRTIHFKDGTSAEVDSIILCTGYIYSYPFLKGSIKYDTGVRTSLMPDNMYKGTVWTKGGNNKLMFAVPCEVIFAFALHDVVGKWICMYVLGKLPNEPPEREAMLESVKELQDGRAKIDCEDAGAKFQSDWMKMLAREVGYPVKYIERAVERLSKCIVGRRDYIWTYRGESYQSIYTDEESPVPEIKWEDGVESDVLMKLYTA